MLCCQIVALLHAVQNLGVSRWVIALNIFSLKPYKQKRYRKISIPFCFFEYFFPFTRLALQFLDFILQILYNLKKCICAQKPMQKIVSAIANTTCTATDVFERLFCTTPKTVVFEHKIYLHGNGYVCQHRALPQNCVLGSIAHKRIVFLQSAQNRIFYNFEHTEVRKCLQTSKWKTLPNWQ